MRVGNANALLVAPESAAMMAAANSELRFIATSTHNLKRISHSDREHQR
jgi:hypothetical protein